MEKGIPLQRNHNICFCLWFLRLRISVLYVLEFCRPQLATDIEYTVSVSS